MTVWVWIDEVNFFILYLRYSPWSGLLLLFQLEDELFIAVNKQTSFATLGYFHSQILTFLARKFYSVFYLEFNFAPIRIVRYIIKFDYVDLIHSLYLKCHVTLFRANLIFPAYWLLRFHRNTILAIRMLERQLINILLVKFEITNLFVRCLFLFLKIWDFDSFRVSFGLFRIGEINVLH